MPNLPILPTVITEKLDCLEDQLTFPNLFFTKRNYSLKILSQYKLGVQIKCMTKLNKLKRKLKLQGRHFGINLYMHIL